MKFLHHILTVSILLLASLAGGFELNGISPEMIRPEADDLLPKNYNYRVLNDMSVRRTWNADENRQLIMDFEPKKDRLVYLSMKYHQPVSMEDATKDLLQLCDKEKVKWSKLPRDVAKKIAVHEDSRAMKLGKGYAIVETTGAGKCYCISIYPRAPKENRRALTDIGAIAYGAKDLAKNTSDKAIAKLMKDEEKRQMTPGKADLAKSVAAAKAAAAARRAAEEKVEEVQEVATTDTPEPDEKEIAVVEKKVKKAPKKKELSGLEALLAKLGIDEPGVVHYSVGGGILLLILIIIFSSSGKKKQKSSPGSAMSAARLNATGLRKKGKK